MNKKLEIYTQKECDYCNDLKKVLNENKIKFSEKDITKYADDYANLTSAIGIRLTPTLVYGEDILVASRDFAEAEDVPFVLKAYDNMNYKKDFLILERLKTFESNTQESLEYMANILTGLHEMSQLTIYGESKTNLKDKEQGEDERL